jgi:hypothetical protein
MAHDVASAEGAPPANPTGPRWRVLLPGLALLALAALAYFNAVSSPFLYDDVTLVLKNPTIRSLDNIPEIVGFTAEGFQVNTRWTRTVSYALEFAAVGTWAPLYHMTNIALHGLVALLAYLLIARISRNKWLGWWSAALFVVHPINTEVVAHVSGRRGLLAAFFSLAALVLLESYTRRSGIWRLALASGAIYLAVFSKELAIMTPVVFVLVDLYGRFNREDRDGREADPETGQATPRAGWLVELREHLVERMALYGFLAAVTACLAVAVVFFSPQVGGLQGSPSIYASRGQDLGPIDRVGLVGHGLGLLVVPAGQTVDYSYDALGFTASSMRPGAWLDLTVLLFAAGLFVWGLAKRNWAGFAGAWFMVFYLPHLGLIPWHEVFAERFLYLPSLGVIVGLSAAGIHVARRFQKPMLLAGAGAVVLGALTFATVVRNEAWSSRVALWESAVSRYPGAARAHKALGDAYLSESRADLALGHYKEAVKILPRYLDARTGVAVTYTARREYNLALQTLDETLESWPTDAKTLNTKAYLHETMGDPWSAMETYELAIKSDPNFAEGYNNLGRLYVQDGDLETAIEMYEKALERNPALTTALLNLAVVYREGLGDEERAEYYQRKADEITQAR